MRVTGRIAVMYRGRKAGEITTKDTTQKDMVHMTAA